MSELDNKTVLITGGFGFLGKHLRSFFPSSVIPTREECDFRRQEMVEWYLSKVKPDIIIHLAAQVGGIGYNQENPASLFYDNAIMGINLIHAAYEQKVEKFIQVGTICAYPKFTPVPFKEEELWNGYPEETNAPYGLAKKTLLVMAQAYRKQYGMNIIYLLPVNLYGEGDNFDLQSSHVIPAMIRKLVEAKRKNKPFVELWGTGTPTREFLYVKDCAEAIYKAFLHYDKEDPVNIGSGNEISIKDLAEKIKRLVNYRGGITFNATKPDGQPRRCLDTSKAWKEFGFKATTSFDNGLKNTIEWFLRNKRTLDYYDKRNNSNSKRYNLE